MLLIPTDPVSTQNKGVIENPEKLENPLFFILSILVAANPTSSGHA